MKANSIIAAFVAVTAVQAAVVKQVDAEITAAPTPSEPHLDKRWKDVIVNKDYKKLQDLKAGSSSVQTTLKPWARTIYATKVELVTPTVIAGVTFAAKPPATTDGLEPWISLKKDGSPVTIKPKMKNGRIEKSSPDYSTYFQTATTVLYSKEELKAHNMAEDQVYEHVEYLPEDKTYQVLNPLLRCTPERYQMRGLAKDQSPEPFCTPQDNNKLYMDKTYFVTWYSRFFDEDVKTVKLHLSYVKESLRQKGMKRDTGFVDSLMEKSSNMLRKIKRSSVIDHGGLLDERSFYVSEALDKDLGYFPLKIAEEWFGEKDYYRKVLISLQPDTVADEDYDHMANYVIVEIAKGSKVAKGYHEDLKKLEEKAAQQLTGDYDIEEGLDYEKYITIITIPTCVILATFLMWLFVRINKKNTDVSFLKNVKFKRKQRTKLLFARNQNTNRSTELPQWDGPKTD